MLYVELAFLECAAAFTFAGTSCAKLIYNKFDTTPGVSTCKLVKLRLCISSAYCILVPWGMLSCSLSTYSAYQNLVRFL